MDHQALRRPSPYQGQPLPIHNHGEDERQGYYGVNRLSPHLPRMRRRIMSPLVLEQKPNETQAEYANRAAELDQPVRGDIKRIDPREFQNLGFLQEANRLFFHPLGLA